MQTRALNLAMHGKPIGKPTKGGGPVAKRKTRRHLAKKK